MGRDYDRDDTSATSKLTYLIVGGGIGAILALLFAPKSGVELRGDIADASRKGLEKSKEAAAQIQERAGEYYEATRERAGELYDTTRERAGEIYDTATEKAGALTEKAKSVAASTANPFTAAIEAGKEAYTQEKRKNESKSITEGRPDWGPGEKPAKAESDDNKA
ncbi:MAG TPA: YtxH domain-containing protein [Pyrinomonadaceae bacterium]|nr:YtxH domain-containing protein [Pyrinomonadaceae bacterium]